MAQVYKVRLPDGRTVRPGEWTSTPLYSTVEIATGNLSPLAAFSYGDGGDVPGSVGPRVANLADTNFSGPGSILQQNEELLLYSLKIELFQIHTTNALFFGGAQEVWAPDPPDMMLTNVLRIQRDTIVVMKIANTKEYQRMPLGFYGAGQGVEYYLGSARSVGTGHTETMLIGANGGRCVGDEREFATPHSVGPGEAFEVGLEFPFGQINGLNHGNDGTGARVRVRVFAEGVRKRPVA